VTLVLKTSTIAVLFLNTCVDIAGMGHTALVRTPGYYCFGADFIYRLLIKTSSVIDFFE
jgi:hypothetical protein